MEKQTKQASGETYGRKQKHAGNSIKIKTGRVLSGFLGATFLIRSIADFEYYISIGEKKPFSKTQHGSSTTSQPLQQA